jgi:hypothetical protein
MPLIPLWAFVACSKVNFAVYLYHPYFEGEFCPYITSDVYTKEARSVALDNLGR